MTAPGGEKTPRSRRRTPEQPQRVRPHSFDATSKYLVERHPVDWLAYLGLHAEQVEVVEADLSTVAAAGDKVLRIPGPPPWLLQLDMQSSYKDYVPDRTLQYAVLLYNRHHLPVRSAVILLRKEADGPEMTGLVQRQDPDGEVTLEFRYRVVRVWEQPMEKVLEGGLGTLPLAPLSSMAL